MIIVALRKWATSRRGNKQSLLGRILTVISLSFSVYGSDGDTHVEKWFSFLAVYVKRFSCMCFDHHAQKTL